MLRGSTAIFCICLWGVFSCSESAPRQLLVKEKVDVLDSLAREPMLAVHPSGDLYVTGYRNASREPQLWKSADGGKRWARVDVGDIAEGADGNSDVDLVIDSEGVIYFLTMKFTRIPEDTTGFDWEMKGEHIAIGVSRNEGATWNWTYLSKGEYDDRPWVEVASDGSVHVIWNDGKGVHYTSSTDQGRTWQRQPDISAKGGSSHFAAGPAGQLAARITPISASGYGYDEGIDLIRLSLDLGQTWEDLAIPGQRDWAPFGEEGTPRWVEPIAWG